MIQARTSGAKEREGSVTPSAEGTQRLYWVGSCRVALQEGAPPRTKPAGAPRRWRRRQCGPRRPLAATGAARAYETMSPAARAREAPGAKQLPGMQRCTASASTTGVGLLKPSARRSEGPRRPQGRELGLGALEAERLSSHPWAQVRASLRAQTLIRYLIPYASVSFGVYFQNSGLRSWTFRPLGTLVRNERPRTNSAAALGPSLAGTHVKREKKEAGPVRTQILAAQRMLSLQMTIFPVFTARKG